MREDDVDIVTRDSRRRQLLRIILMRSFCSWLINGFVEARSGDDGGVAFAGLLSAMGSGCMRGYCECRRDSTRAWASPAVPAGSVLRRLWAPDRWEWLLPP